MKKKDYLRGKCGVRMAPIPISEEVFARKKAIKKTYGEILMRGLEAFESDLKKKS
jgi:hypothetical protein